MDSTPALPPHLAAYIGAGAAPPRAPVASTSTTARAITPFRPPPPFRTPSVTPAPSLFTPSIAGGDATEDSKKPKPRKRKKADGDQKPAKRVRTGQVALGETANQARVSLNKRRTVLDIPEPQVPPVVLALRAVEAEAAATDARGDEMDADLIERLAKARQACEAALADYTDAASAKSLAARARSQSALLDDLTVDYNRQWGQAMLEGQMLSAVHRVIYHRLVDLQSAQAHRKNQERQQRLAEQKKAEDEAAEARRLQDEAEAEIEKARKQAELEAEEDAAADSLITWG